MGGRVPRSAQQGPGPMRPSGASRLFSWLVRRPPHTLTRGDSVRRNDFRLQRGGFGSAPRARSVWSQAGRCRWRWPDPHDHAGSGAVPAVPMVRSRHGAGRAGPRRPLPPPSVPGPPAAGRPGEALASAPPGHLPGASESGPAAAWGLPVLSGVRERSFPPSAAGAQEAPQARAPIPFPSAR